MRWAESGGDMWVFIKGIPDEMGSRDLEIVIKQLLKSTWMPFRLTGRIRISGTKILKIVHTRSRLTEFHGLVQIEPKDKLVGVIEKINQASLDGRCLEAHVYAKRLTRRDRRKVQAAGEQYRQNDRRRIERRRKHLVSQIIDASL